MNDLELEDIESRLYSQVYHSNVEEEQDMDIRVERNDFVKPVEAIKRPAVGRYFQTGPWSPTYKFQNKGVISKQNPPVRNDYDPSQGFYSKNCARPYRPDISINQVVVVSQQRPIVCLSPKEAKRARRKLKAKEAKKRKRTAAKLAKLIQREVVTSDTVITLSESDDDSCVIVDAQWPLVSVRDSDDENKNVKEVKECKSDITYKGVKNISLSLDESFTDDVILIESVNSPIEVINLDEDPECSLQKNDNVQAVETASVTTDISVTNSPTKSKKQLHQERKELLRTPDSASNDFMSNSGIELHQKNFNFSLHGSDFNNGEFLKPAKRTETCETESSSSTTDLNTNMMKTVVFNEIEFPKDDIFSESNLESFGNFITPYRSSPNSVTAQSSPLRTPDVQKQNTYSSDSSSESDFEESQENKQKELTKKVKNLPELSPMVLKEHITTPPVGKKSKKLSSIGSKYDLMNETAPESTTKKVTQKGSIKKKGKNKKKKSGLDCVDPIIAISSNSVGENVDEKSLNENNDESAHDDARQSKRKSGQMEDKADNCENYSKKKLKTKKRKSDASVFQDDTNPVPNDSPQKTIEISNTLNSGSKIDTSGREPISNEQNKKINDNENIRNNSPAGQENTVLNNSDATVLRSRNTSNEQGMIKDKSMRKDTFDGFVIIDESMRKDTFDGFVIIDESFGDPDIEVLSSEGESVLSPLTEEVDIKLINCKNIPSTSKTDTDSKDFDVKEIQRKMSNDPKLWSILEVDKMPLRSNGKGGRRCNKCRELGHMAIRCPNKVVPKCRLCGESGHYEPRCPNKICTQCGQRSPYSTTHCSACYKFGNYQCQLCSLLGHVASACPDLWRRYHLTTTEGPLTTYEGPMKERSQLWCSGCARPGHLEHSCDYYRSLYPPSDPYIKSYRDIYVENTNSAAQEQTPHFAPSQVNYGVNQFNQNYLVPRVDQRHAVNLYYNQNDHRPQRNPYFANTYPGNRVYVPQHNQQNLYHGAENLFQLAVNNFPQTTQNSYRGSYNQYSFQDNLPGFISFDEHAPVANLTKEPEYNPFNFPLPKEQIGRLKVIFYNSPVHFLHHLIQENLQRLSKLSYQVEINVKELRKRGIPRDNAEKEKYYEMMNMVLFGVFKFFDGKKHLEKLKQFKLRRLKGKLHYNQRNELYKSYCYIFGIEKHDGIDYNALLRRI